VDTSESPPIGEDDVVDDIHQSVGPHRSVPTNLKIGDIILTVLVEEAHEDLRNGAE
jgi:hypothetical protein